MKNALVFLSLLSYIFSKFEQQSIEIITIKATNIRYPEQCTTFPKDTTFYIEYEKNEKVKGKATFTLTVDKVEVNCVFNEIKGSCTTQKDVTSGGTFKINENVITLITGEEASVNIDIKDVNNPPEKYNKDYVDLSSTLNTSQKIIFPNSTTTKTEDKNEVIIEFQKKLERELKVYKGNDDNKKELKNCIINETAMQCPIEKEMFPLDKDNESKEMNYDIYVENACGDLYSTKIGISVQSSHYIKPLRLLILLLILIL